MTQSSFPLPQDWRDAVLVGRIDMGEGPTPVVVKEGRVFDVSKTAPTVSVLLEKWNGVPDAFRFFITLLLVLVYLTMNNDGIDDTRHAH